MSASPALDYAAYSNLFQQLGFGLSPAECHGGLVGLLCAVEGIDNARWSQEIFAERAEGVIAQVGDEAALRNFYERTVEGLEDVDYGFTLVLPDEGWPLHERAEALSQWCQGFLWGLGLGGIQDQARLPGDVNEVMQDMAEISRLNFTTAIGSNDDETAYTEIVEYVRMAALLIYEELRLLRGARPDGNAVH